MADDFVTVRGKKYYIKKSELNLRLKKINDISEIEGLDNLTNLQELILDHNKIKEVRGLENLTQLRELDLRYNEIREIKGLEHLTNLQKLYLKGNPIRTDEKHLVDRSAQEIVRFCQEKAKRESEVTKVLVAKEAVIKPTEVVIPPSPTSPPSPPVTNVSITPSTPTNICQSCGLSIEEGMIFCPHCGAEL